MLRHVAILVSMLFVVACGDSGGAPSLPVIPASTTSTPTLTGSPVAASYVPAGDRQYDDFSEAAHKLRAGYEQLMGFKGESWFRHQCLGTAERKLSRWLSAMEGLRMPTLYDEVGADGNVVWLIATEYCKSGGRETDITRYHRENMDSDWLDMRPVPTPVDRP